MAGPLGFAGGVRKMVYLRLGLALLGFVCHDVPCRRSADVLLKLRRGVSMSGWRGYRLRLLPFLTRSQIYC